MYGNQKSRRSPLNLNKYNFEVELFPEESDDNLDKPNTLRNTLTGLRKDSNVWRYDPSRGPGTTGEKTVPNQPPPLTPAVPEEEAGTGSSADIMNIMKIVSATKGQPLETIPGQQPGTDFDMAAVNAPEAGRVEVKPEFDADNFARMAGAIGAAIGGPDTWQGRLGAVASGLASENIKKREGAPDLALDRRLKEARIKNLERPERSRSITDIELNSETGAWEYGGRDVATGEFFPYRDATDAEIESKVEGKPIDTDEIDIHGDLLYPGSSGARTLRDAHQGAASIPKPSRVLLKDAQAGYGSGLEAAITGAKGAIPPPERTNEATDDSLVPDERPEMPETGIDYTPESLKKSKPTGSQKTGTGKIPAKPPDSLLQPEGQRDFKDRQAYSASVIGKMGFDPFTLDPDKEIERAQENLPEIFKKAFGGKILYRDIDTLEKNEKKHWNAVHRAYNVHAESVAKDQIARGKEQYKMEMKAFEDKLAEKKAMPGAIEKSLKSIFVSDEDGRKVGKIPAGILAKANKDAEQLMNTGNMTAAEVVAKITDDMVREKMQIAAIDEALNAIPEWKAGWFTTDAKDAEKVKPIIAEAREQGVDEKEIKDRLRNQGWSGENIARVMAEEPGVADVSRGTGDPQQRYKTPEDIRDAFKSGKFGDPKSDEARQKAKQFLRQAMS